MMSLCCLKGALLTFAIGVISFVIFKLIYKYFTSNQIYKSLKNKRVIITGGSSGIGLSLAKLAYYHGAQVTIIGRSLDKLNLAKEEICTLRSSDSGTVELLSVDICLDYLTLEEKLKSNIGNTDILINCAGGAISRTLVDMNHSDIEGQMRLNYFGSANITKLFLPSMLEKNTATHVVFISSMSGQIGIYGYAAYSASKYALRGLAESLQMEVGHRGVSVTLAFPPDTRTPGYKIEQIDKPEITKRLSEAAGLIEPDYVAKCIWGSVLRKEFFSSVGMDGWLLTQLTYGMCLPGSWCDMVTLVFFSPLLRIIAFGYGMWMRYIVRNTAV